MYNKLKSVEERFDELTEKISDPKVIEDQATWQKLMKERADIEAVVEKYREFKQVRTDIDSAKELLNDKEFMMDILKINGLLINYASSALKNDKDIVMEAFKQNSYALGYVSCRWNVYL